MVYFIIIIYYYYSICLYSISSKKSDCKENDRAHIHACSSQMADWLEGSRWRQEEETGVGNNRDSGSEVIARSNTV
jgi:hypothetical protein